MTQTKRFYLCVTSILHSPSLPSASPSCSPLRPGSPHAAHAQSNATVTILADRLNVRSGPGTGYGVVASAKKRREVQRHRPERQLRLAQNRQRRQGPGLGVGQQVLCQAQRRLQQHSGGRGKQHRQRSGPAAGKGKQGCALLLNKLKTDVKLSVKRSDGWQSSWSIGAGGQNKVCVDPGSYTATFTASGMPGNMAFPVTVKGGEYYEIPLSLPGN